jgi:nicotinate phosphoribosyltransferase
VPHALIQLFPTEEEAFTAVAAAFNRYTLLLDTYDPRQAIQTAITVAQRAQRDLGHTLAAVRLDSGDIVADSKYVRAELAKAGMSSVRILASGDLDEFAIADLLAAGAEVDSFGVGTSLGVGAGSVEHGVSGGALGGVYKEVFYLDEDSGAHPKVKLAGEKTTWPGRKEIYRHPEWREDVILLEDEPEPEGYMRLLRPVMRQGRLAPGSMPPLGEVWEHAQASLRALPEQYRALKGAPAYPVRFGEAVQSLRAEAAREASVNLPVESAANTNDRARTKRE